MARLFVSLFVMLIGDSGNVMLSQTFGSTRKKRFTSPAMEWARVCVCVRTRMCAHAHTRVLSCFSRVWLFTTHQALTIACQASQSSLGFPRQEYWSGLPFPSPGDLPNPGIKPESLMSPALAGGFFTTSTTWESLNIRIYTYALKHTYILKN